MADPRHPADEPRRTASEPEGRRPLSPDALLPQAPDELLDELPERVDDLRSRERVRRADRSRAFDEALDDLLAPTVEERRESALLG